MDEKPSIESVSQKQEVETSIAHALQEALSKAHSKVDLLKKQLFQAQREVSRTREEMSSLEDRFLVAEDHATYDPRTHLYRPETFEDAAGNMLDAGISGALVILDLQGFGDINAELGHQMGNSMLEWAADAIRRRMRVRKRVHRYEDLYCRYGGDEFVVLLTNVTEEQVSSIVNAINAEAQKIDKRLRFYSGHAMTTGVDDTLESLFAVADEQLWAHKEKIKEEKRREKEAHDYEEYLTIKDDPAKLEAFMRRLSRSAI